MEIILNAGLGIGALMFLLLLFKRGKKREDYFFLFWIVVTLGQIAFYGVTIYRFELQSVWAIASFGLPLLGAPLLFLYILALTGRSVAWKTIFIHLSVYPVYVLLLFLLQEHDKIVLIASEGLFRLPKNPSLWMQYYAVPLALSGLFYCIWDLALLRKHGKNIMEFFSFHEKVNLKWVNYIVYSYFLLFLVASFLIFGAIHFQLLPIANAFALVGITLSLMLIAFGFYGFRQTAVFSDVDFGVASDSNSTTSEKASYSKSGLTSEKIEVLANQLSSYMAQEKPFLNEDLNLTRLAEEIQISPPHLSQVINQYFQKNFYDFINQYRVEEAKKRLLSPDYRHLSILGLAFDCGFKSKSSFNRYFKKYTGTAPSEFKKK
ncbi:helix-turn-helix domain-containing protein [Ulvibacterium sp.]|uniref:AraC family transcriptional regulator n=1 Tax=Ulvibacterium sp. TaxID=2665914 RepID=UPI00262B24EA|nr:helix-turn-helix domain-containing protein [Ulvibacterium sp.]